MERKTCEVHYDGRVERKTRTTDVEEEDKDDGGGGVALIEVDSSGSSSSSGSGNNGNSQNSNSNVELVECIVIKGTVVKEDAWIDHFAEQILLNDEVKCTTRSSRTTKNRKLS